MKLARPVDVGLLDVDRVHFGAELDEQLGRGRAHSRRGAAHDDPLALVPEHVLHRSLPASVVAYSIVIACSGQLSAPIRACAASASATCSSSTTAVAELVGAEHVGSEHVTATVTDTEVGVDANRHHAAERIRSPVARGGIATLAPCTATRSKVLGRDRRRGRARWPRARAAAARRSADTTTHTGAATDERRAELPARLHAAAQPDPGARFAQQLPRRSRTRRCSPRCAKVNAAIAGEPRLRPPSARRSSSTLGVRQIELDVWADPHGGKYAQPSLLQTLGTCRRPIPR